MRQVLLTLALIFALAGVAQATPGLVQLATYGGANNSITSGLNYVLPNNVLSGNLVVCWFQVGNGTETYTVSDDKSNSYTVVQDGNHNADQESYFAYKENVTNGPHVVTVVPSAARTYMSGGWCMEWSGIATSTAKDVSAGASDATSTYTPGSMTTTADGDLILTALAETNVDAFVTDQVNSSFTIPTNFTGFLTDYWLGQGAAYWIQPTQGAVNPAWDATAHTYIVSQIAFKAAAAGTSASTTPRILGTWHQGLDYHGVHASPFGIRIPFTSTATSLYCSYIGLHDPGTMSGTYTWTATGASVKNGTGGNSGFVRGYYVLSPTIGTTDTMSLAYTGSGGTAPGDTIICSAMVGISTFDAHASDNTQSGSGTSLTIGTTTPTNSNGLMFFTVGVDSETVTATNTGTFLATTYVTPSQCASPCANDENNGWSYYPNPNTSGVAPSFTTTAAAGPFAWIGDAFGPPAAGGGAAGVNKKKKLEKLQ